MEFRKSADNVMSGPPTRLLVINNKTNIGSIYNAKESGYRGLLIAFVGEFDSCL
jgi:hypothetical protein